MAKRIRELILAVLAMAAMCAALLVTADGDAAARQAKELSGGWYILQNGQKIAVELPDVFSAEDGEMLVLYNDSLTAADAGLTIAARGAQYGLQIILDGETLYDSADGSAYRISRMQAKRYCDAVIPDSFDGGTLELVFQTPEDGRYSVSEVLLGTDSELLLYRVERSAWVFAGAVIFGVLSLIAVGVAVYLYCGGLNARRWLDAAMFLLLCGVWLFSDLSVLQHFPVDTEAVCVVSFYAFMLLPVPMICLVRDTGEMAKYRLLDVLIALFYINALVQGVLYLFFGVDLSDMLFVTHLLLVGAVVLTTALLIYQVRQKSDMDIRFILSAFVAVAVGGLAALLLYWLFDAAFYTVVFGAGVLVFVLLVMADIIITMTRNVRRSTEMQVYQRMAYEDWMTGLGNRRPFEDFLSGLQRGERKYENIALIYLDLNNLKQVNDQYGHAAGDAMILAAATCISKVFGTAGTCYRLGGDEFGVLLPDPSSSQEEWFRRLDAEIDAYNKSNSAGRWRLSIARGWSDLRDTDGRYKSISDWKYEADCRMYADKGREVQA